MGLTIHPAASAGAPKNGKLTNTCRPERFGMRYRDVLVVAASIGVSVAIAIGASVRAHATPARAAVPTGIHKIQHVIIIMQENRSFDSYFGTYPGADGIPAGVCLHDPRNGGCVRPYADHQDSNMNEPHGAGVLGIRPELRAQRPYV